MSKFINFKTNINKIELPKKFTFPFYYEPHHLTEIASEELQEYLKTSNELNHSFGIETNNHEIGKMFGVLVVKNLKNEIGYLSAYSGNIKNQHLFKKFVPPIYDILSKDSFFIKDNHKLKDLSIEIENLDNNSDYLALKNIVKNNNLEVQKIIEIEEKKLKKRKQLRKEKKQKSALSKSLKNQLAQESLHDNFYFKELVCYYQDKFSKQQEELNTFKNKIRILKQLRKEKSNKLHQKIFDQYHFLNIKKKDKSLNNIFNDLNLQAPAGTGDCAAPKLLQYAFLNDLKPIALAEFWWGKAGNSKIRKHKNYYPSCSGKCKPILSHMLDGMELDKNPLIENLAEKKLIEILFEDECLLVINKPNELLSVPGKVIKDSVYTRLKAKYPLAADYLIVHRLDMSTSGIMLIAKTKKANQFLQKQFIDKTIQKKYIAILDGVIQENKGEINLPLRVDLEDRPKQLVCYEHGKHAKTKWKVLTQKNNQTRIEFTPITGRTHQLRVHSAHKLGLNTAIVGDDLYGKKANRLHLHAAYIKFIHPLSKKNMEFSLKDTF